jgi:hypothetical protein
MGPSRKKRSVDGVEIRSVFLYPDELERLDAAATAMDISRSRYAIKALLRAIEEDCPEVPRANETPEPKPQRSVPAEQNTAKTAPEDELLTLVGKLGAALAEGFRRHMREE